MSLTEISLHVVLLTLLHEQRQSAQEETIDWYSSFSSLLTETKFTKLVGVMHSRHTACCKKAQELEMVVQLYFLQFMGNHTVQY